MASMTGGVVRRSLKKLTMLATDYRYILYGGYICDLGIVITIAMYFASTFDEICSSYSFSHTYKLNSLASSGY